jgi:quercetin dioxygenase-like cupin family protein
MCFVCVEDVEWEELDWGELGWVVRPANVPEGTKLCVLDVKIQPGQGHDFHRHPNQEEVIFLRSGTVEQWVRDERRTLTAGDAAFIPEGAVHATFVADDAAEPARLLVVLGPSHTDGGYETVDVSTEEPWASLRASRS